MRFSQLIVDVMLENNITIICQNPSIMVTTTIILIEIRKWTKKVGQKAKLKQ